MNIFEIYRNHVLQAVWQLFPDSKTDAITLEPPRDAAHGDLSTNAAMVLAGQLKAKGEKANPREIAEKLVEKLKTVQGIAAVSVAGAGFINFTLDVAIWHSVLPVILADGNSYGNSTIGAGKKINVEYVSANPTGPLHIGHTRGAVYGDALATLLMKSGHEVTKEYYINDAGVQIGVLAQSALLRYREALGEAIEIPAGLYPGEYLKGVGEGLKEKYDRELVELAKQESLTQPTLPPHLANQRDEVFAFCIASMMELIKADLRDLGIVHDIFTSEAKLHKDKKIEKAIERLTALGHLYRGTLEPPKGEKVEDWEAKEQLLFRASQFGDDADRTVQKSNGDYAYFAGDLALTMDKVSRGYDELVYMLGADHGGYVKRLEAITTALSEGKAKADVKLCQLVHLTKNGEPVKMSKRAGNFVTARDVIDEVGKDIIRFVMLMRKTNADMDFDLAKVKEQSKDNPVFYVQYAHARAKSVLRLAREQMPEAFAASAATGVDFSLLSHPAELALIKLLASWPRLVEQAATAHEPHRIIYFLEELAASFHGLWNVGSKDADIRFVLPEQPALTAARLALARALTVVVASGLNVCGVEPVEELR